MLRCTPGLRARGVAKYLVYVMINKSILNNNILYRRTLRTVNSTSRYTLAVRY
jgi:hypothetical protein